jgi:hypothetical protein
MTVHLIGSPPCPSHSLSISSLWCQQAISGYPTTVTDADSAVYLVELDLQGQVNLVNVSDKKKGKKTLFLVIIGQRAA